MILVYASRTNNIERFIERLDIEEIIKITEEYLPTLNKPFWLITYTDHFGAVPDLVEKFLNINGNNLKAIAASGNRNFGNNFANSANIISQKYNVPIILKFELSGSQEEAKFFKEKFLLAQKN